MNILLLVEAAYVPRRVAVGSYAAEWSRPTLSIRSIIDRGMVIDACLTLLYLMRKVSAALSVNLEGLQD
jgi:hypothetical protein